MKTPEVIALGAGIVVVTGASSVAAAALTSNGRVGHIECADGTHPGLRALLRAWCDAGTHDVDVAPASTDWTPPGGLRTDESEQAAAASSGLSNATTLATTPHGRGCALDVWPVDFNPRRGFDTQPGMEQMMRLFGEWAENQVVTVDGVTSTFTWGGRFSRPDLPHVEIKGWQHLPYPPPAYGGGFV